MPVSTAGENGREYPGFHAKATRADLGGLPDRVGEEWKVEKHPPDLTAGEFNRSEC